MAFCLRRISSILFWISAVLFISLVSHANPIASQPFVKVQLGTLYEIRQLSLESSQGLEIRVEETKQGQVEQKSFLAGKIFQLSLQRDFIKISNTDFSPARRVEVLPKNSGQLFVHWKGSTKKVLIGKLLIIPKQGVLKLLVEIPLETYVMQVLVSELDSSFPLEALKAQAVLIRTQAFRNRTPHHREGFDFCDMTHCQVFQSERKASEKFQAAVQATKGMILTYQQEPIEALYHSHCGGHTAANQEIFGGKPLPYLQGTYDGPQGKESELDSTYCYAKTYHPWLVIFTLKELRKILSDPTLQNIEVLDKNSNGRPEEVILRGRQTRTISAQEFLQIFGKEVGWRRLQSTSFIMEKREDSFIFTGVGKGHGVGFCQWGAYGMAKQNFDFRAILKHYFPGTHLEYRSSL